MEIILKNLMVQLSFEEQLDINRENQVYLWGGVCVWGGVCLMWRKEWEWEMEYFF